MKSYRLHAFGCIDNLTPVKESTPEPAAYEVMVQVKVVSLNFRDLAIINGSYPLPATAGLIPVSDAVGEVVAVGKQVTRFKVGDRVVNAYMPTWYGGSVSSHYWHGLYGSNIDGWLTEFKCVNEEALLPVPVYMSDVEAATLPCAAVTAWSALNGPCPVNAGDTVLIQGTGGVSLFALQLAQAMGAGVMATTSSDHKADYLVSLGAKDVINYQTEPAWGGRVRQLNHGQGVDRIIEVGGVGTLNQSIQAIAAGKEIALIGFVAKAEQPVDMNAFFKNYASMRRIAVGSRSDFESMLRIMLQHQIHPVIDQTFAFDDALGAFRHLQARQHIGKVVIKM